MSCPANSLPHGPCLLFVDGRPVRLRRADGRPDRPHPLLHAYGEPSGTGSARPRLPR